MKYSVEFYYRGPEESRPDDYCQDHPIYHQGGPGSFVPIPSVGDAVTYIVGGEIVARKVLARTFLYSPEHCTVSIVVGDMSAEEYESRVKS